MENCNPFLKCFLKNLRMNAEKLSDCSLQHILLLLNSVEKPETDTSYYPGQEDGHHLHHHLLKNFSFSTGNDFKATDDNGIMLGLKRSTPRATGGSKLFLNALGHFSGSQLGRHYVRKVRLISFSKNQCPLPTPPPSNYYDSTFFIQVIRNLGQKYAQSYRDRVGILGM